MSRPLVSLLRAGLFCSLVAGAVIVGLQYSRSDIQKTIGDYPDEPSHFVTARMIHDYILTSPHPSPMAFAKSYYLHYPKVAVGQWPPLFHVAWALWMMVFPATPNSLLLLSTIMAICYAAVPGMVVAKRYGLGWGVAAALMLASAPVAFEQSRMILVDYQCAILCFLATIALAEFLESRDRRYAVAFCLLTVTACYTKYDGFLIFGVAALIFLLRREFRPKVWLTPAAALAVALLLTAPFPLIFASNVNGVLPPLGWRDLVKITMGYITPMLAGGGGILVLLAAGGYWAALRRPTKATYQPWFLAGMAALAIFSLIFHILTVRDVQTRYLDPVFPPLVVLAVEGLRRLQQAGMRGRRTIAVVLAAGVVAMNLDAAWRLPRKVDYPFAAIAEWVVTKTPPDRRILLVDSEFRAEGMVVAEIVAREPRPTTYVLRATKILAKTNWNASYYHPYFTEIGPLEQYLMRIPVHYLIIDTTPTSAQWLHHKLLQEMTESHPERWKPVLHYGVPNACNGCDAAVTVYELVDSPAASSPNLDITVPEMIRRPLMFTLFDHGR